MTDTLPAAAINAAEVIAAIEARPSPTVTPAQVRRVVGQFHDLGMAEGPAWDAWIESLKTAQWAPQD
jgi:hypothetical protein